MGTTLGLTNARWRKSSYSGSTGGDCVECAALNGTAWRKSSYSGGTGGECLEVAELPGPHIAIRDSKWPDGPRVTVSVAAFTALVRGATR
ncbi:DUF397 domain-containing protein [Streptomyces sp. AN091965]|uniref:DUF397 domain-containing protein n=1 Tax=Streptomyces sp. AN091965 TaxID=2927803 RepID=UPI001F6068D7|nr:DUF397 domain-containing protein [Streptomyces sp. AN091965]MCI3931926.1 DUF397 domain-containing protein [Streptomyces sp. AN091965]